MAREIASILHISSIAFVLSLKRVRAIATFAGVFNNVALGRPPRLPLARAAASPAWVRSRIRSRSNSASAPKI